MSVSVSLAGLPCHPHRPIKLLLAAMQIRCYFSGCWRRRPGALPHMWAAGRESDKESEETENILMKRNDKLSQSRMRHETRQGPELILTVSHQIRPRLSYVSEARLTRKLWCQHSDCWYLPSSVRTGLVLRRQGETSLTMSEFSWEYFVPPVATCTQLGRRQK